MDDPTVRRVASFEELLTTPFDQCLNACYWPRSLKGDFAEVVTTLERGGALEGGINALEEEDLEALRLTPAGRTAVESILADVRRLRHAELWPELSCVVGAERERRPGPFVPEVYSWHVDSATVAADTWLCTYHGAASEGLRNAEARRRVDIPEIRAELLRLFGGSDGPEFADWLSEHAYDLHYAPLPDARPYGFGLHHLWRIAVAWPGSLAAPCIHRAPETLPLITTRLLLLS